MILIILAAVLLSAFFSGAETVLISCNRLEVRHRAQEGDKAARLVRTFLEDPRRLLGTTLVGTNLSNVLASSAAALFGYHRAGTSGAGLATLISTLCILVFGEIIPKSLGRQFAGRLVYGVTNILRVFYVILYPLIIWASAAALVALRIVGIKQGFQSFLFTREELEGLIGEGERAGIVAPPQHEIITSVLEFGETTLEEVMMPRTDIVAVGKGTTVRDAIRVVQQSGHSRLPVYEDDLDEVEGIVHVFDLLAAPDVNAAVDSLVRPITMVPESKKCDELLMELQRRREHMAVVLDEYGGTAGLVTVEDLVEELVGEIADEHEKTEVTIRKVSEDTYYVDGTAEIEDLNERLGWNIPEGEYETIAGFVLERLGRIPVKGEVLSFGNLDFEISSSDGRRIGTIKVTVGKKVL